MSMFTRCLTYIDRHSASVAPVPSDSAETRTRSALTPKATARWKMPAMKHDTFISSHSGSEVLDLARGGDLGLGPQVELHTHAFLRLRRHVLA